MKRKSISRNLLGKNIGSGKNTGKVSQKKWEPCEYAGFLFYPNYCKIIELFLYWKNGGKKDTILSRIVAPSLIVPPLFFQPRSML